MKIKTKHIAILLIILASIFIYVGCAPVREFYRFPAYKGENNFTYQAPAYHAAKKTILLVADHKGTEVFDLMAPFYLFQLTHQANVYIVAEKKYPVVVMKGFFVLPHFTFRQIDSLGIRPSAIIIPNLSAMDKKELNPTIVNWIKSKYTDTTKFLSVCAGSLTAAATGLYDGKPLTTHASEFKHMQDQFDAPKWVKNTSVTKSGNLYSTAGVSNAVEGSLQLIKDMFGEQSLRAVIDSIHYPNAEIKLAHQSIPLGLSSNFTIGNKIYFKRNSKVGLLLQNSIDEFQLAAVIDTYHRTFPGSIKTFQSQNTFVTSKHGLILLPTGDVLETSKLDEIHVLDKARLVQKDYDMIGKTTLVTYDMASKEYIMNDCLKRIEQQYGPKFTSVVHLLLDYNE